ncbi:MAG: hypothetical protein ACRDZ4_21590 [Egibacteraceae bacterium]
MAGHDPEQACVQAHYALDVVALTRVHHARNEMPGQLDRHVLSPGAHERLRLVT